MKYLAYLKIPKQLEERVGFYRELITPHITKIPSEGLHSTLMVGQFEADKEDEMINVLEGIVKSTFTASLVGKVEDFGGGTLVAPLMKTDYLRKLHYQIIRRLGEFINRDEIFPLPAEFSDDEGRLSVYKRYGSPYFAQFYNPHITICHVDREKLSVLPQMQTLKDYSWQVEKFYLSKKTGDGWEEVREFPLQL